MPLVDMPLDELRRYSPPPDAQPDFSAFWERTLAEAATQPLDVQLERVANYPVDEVEVSRLSYAGWRGTRVTTWFMARPGAVRQPSIVFYHGYSGNKGQPYDYLPWALQGYTVLAVDVRGQSGDTTDAMVYPGGHHSGWMTMGITDPENYYYRGVYVDCLRALDVMATRPEVDMQRIGVHGISQGGGLSLVVAALDSRPRLAMSGIPFLCHFSRAVAVSDTNPYKEIAVYLNRRPEHAEQAFRTLSYFDAFNMTDRIDCPVLMTVGLQDLVCPPSTVFAAYNRIRSEPREIRVFPYGVHEIFPMHWETKLLWARRHLKDAPAGPA
jgi:cephalosporin-C deacetylase